MLEENLISILNRMPDAMARIKGSDSYPKIDGNVLFYQLENGVLVIVDVIGLPTLTGKCDSSIHGFHIHEGKSCSGDQKDPFADSMMHYNPSNCPHPYHLGDLPPLFNVDGRAFLAVLTDRFKVEEIIGRTIIIHSSFDDFKSQPSGNAGSKIACGQIIPG